MTISAKLWVRREDGIYYFYKKEPRCKDVIRWGSRVKRWVPGYVISLCVSDFRQLFRGFPLVGKQPVLVNATLRLGR